MTHFNATAYKRFEKPLLSLEALMLASETKKNPAIYMFQNGARNYLFQLEGLCRIYKKIMKSSFFEQLEVTYKHFEDQLGKIDYFDYYYQEIKNNKKLGKSASAQKLLFYFENEKNKVVTELNEWLAINTVTNDISYFFELKEKLKKMHWLDEKTERKKIQKYLSKECLSIEMLVNKGDINLQHLEKGVHELRRKLRWISIYASALIGLIQIRDSKYYSPSFKKYLTPEIIKSPFNKLAEPSKTQESIEVYTHLFFALSWMIQEIGKHKDDGLRILTLDEAIVKTKLTKEAKHMHELIIPKHSKSIGDICDYVTYIGHVFINEDKVLQQLNLSIKNQK